jgi:hypothetical protein
MIYRALTEKKANNDLHSTTEKKANNDLHSTTEKSKD